MAVACGFGGGDGGGDGGGYLAVETVVVMVEDTAVEVTAAEVTAVQVTVETVEPQKMSGVVPPTESEAAGGGQLG